MLRTMMIDFVVWTYVLSSSLLAGESADAPPTSPLNALGKLIPP